MRKHLPIVISFLACCSVGLSQTSTKIDLRNQTKQVDFTAADVTRPLKMGTTIPASCVQGELFFKANAPAGSNIYGCIAANTWSIQGGGVQGSGTVTLQMDGIAVGARSVLNIVSGEGLINTIIDNGSALFIQHTIDSAFISTRPEQQAGTSLLCASSGASSSAYTCLLHPSLAAYASGMLLRWIPDVNGTGGPTTLNVDGLGAVSLRLSDSTDPTAADIVAGRLYEVWYDGVAFRLPSGPAMPLLGTTPAACTVSARGRVWLTPGVSGVKDALLVCAKDAGNTYAWRTLY